MGSSTGRRPSDLDTSQPGVRLIQSWIRSQTNLALQLLDGTSISGVPRWIDSDYVALQSDAASDLMLVNRHAIALIRPLV